MAGKAKVVGKAKKTPRLKEDTSAPERPADMVEELVDGKWMEKAREVPSDVMEKAFRDMVQVRKAGVDPEEFARITFHKGAMVVLDRLQHHILSPAGLTIAKAIADECRATIGGDGEPA
jgi:hypothetical protein